MKLQLKRICPSEDADLRVYFSKEKLVEHVCVGEAGMPEGLLDLPGSHDPDPFLELLLQIPGVYQVECHMYHVAIRKAPLHDWTEIEPNLLRLLSSFNLGEGSLEA